MLIVIHTEELDAQQGTLLQVEGTLQLPVHQAVEALLALCAIASLARKHLDLDSPHGMDNLHRVPADLLEGGAQALVATYEFLAASTPEVDVERTAQAHGRGNVIGTAGHQLFEEPQSLLRERQGEAPLAAGLGETLRQQHALLGRGHLRQIDTHELASSFPASSSRRSDSTSSSDSSSTTDPEG